LTFVADGIQVPANGRLDAAHQLRRASLVGKKQLSQENALQILGPQQIVGAERAQQVQLPARHIQVVVGDLLCADVANDLGTCLDISPLDEISRDEDEHQGNHHDGHQHVVFVTLGLNSSIDSNRFNFDFDSAEHAPSHSKSAIAIPMANVHSPAHFATK
jgi:hypothetical protein